MKNLLEIEENYKEIENNLKRSNIEIETLLQALKLVKNNETKETLIKHIDKKIEERESIENTIDVLKELSYFVVRANNDIEYLMDESIEYVFKGDDFVGKIKDFTEDLNVLNIEDKKDVLEGFDTQDLATFVSNYTTDYDFFTKTDYISTILENEHFWDFIKDNDSDLERAFNGYLQLGYVGNEGDKFISFNNIDMNYIRDLYEGWNFYDIYHYDGTADIVGSVSGIYIPYTEDFKEKVKKEIIDNFDVFNFTYEIEE